MATNEIIKAQRPIAEYVLPPREDLLLVEDLSEYRDLNPRNIEDNETIRMFWKAAFREPEISLEHTFPYRLLSGWRIVREMAYLKGYVEVDELLGDSRELSKPNYWFREGPIMFQRESVVRGSNWCVAGELRHLPLLPPLCKTKADVRNLISYIRAAQKIITYLKINISSSDPNQRRFGTQGFDDPRMIHSCFPGRLQIIEAERMLVDNALRKVLDDGQLKARDWVIEEYGITPYEAQTVIRIARNQAKKRLDGDIEEEKGLLMMKIEDLAQRARGRFDLRTELQALKMIYHAAGMGRAEIKDVLSEFIGAVKKVEREPASTIPAPQVAEYRMVEDDEAKEEAFLDE